MPLWVIGHFISVLGHARSLARAGGGKVGRGFPPASRSTDLIADRKAYSSEKHRQGDAQFIAGPAHCFIWAAPLPRSLTFEVGSG